MTDNMRWSPCKVQWCLAKQPKQEYELLSTCGNCLEEVGVPSKGRAVINRTIKPQIGDLVWCNNAYCTIHGFIKQVQSFEGDEMVVSTRYVDHSKDFSFYCSEFYGVVEMVFDMMGNLCYRREQNNDG